MKKRRRLRKCPNCLTLLNHGDNYCPKCGQENHALTFSISELWNDFVGSLLNFDGKIFTTFKMIFTRPGKVPKDIISGKKVRYVPTIRFYFFVSFIYFLILNFGVNLMMESDKLNKQIINIFTDNNTERIPIDGSAYNLYKDASDAELLKLAIVTTDSLESPNIKSKELKFLKSKNAIESILLVKEKDKGLDNSQHKIGSITVTNNKNVQPLYHIDLKVKPEFDTFYINDLKITRNQLENFYLNRDEIPAYIESNDLSSNYFRSALFKTIIEMRSVLLYGPHAEKKNYIKNLLKKNLSNFSLALLLIMPISSLILYLFYFYKSPKIVPHILFTIHLHTVILILLSILFIITTTQSAIGVTLHPIVEQTLFWGILLYGLVYFILAIKRFYNSSWRSAILKSFAINILYTILLLSIVIAVFIVSMI